MYYLKSFCRYTSDLDSSELRDLFIGHFVTVWALYFLISLPPALCKIFMCTFKEFYWYVSLETLPAILKFSDGLLE